MITSKSVYLCIFMVEMMVSICISFTAYRMLKFIMPSNGASVAAAVSTLSALWLLHVTIKTIQLLANASKEVIASKEKGRDMTKSIQEFQSKMTRDHSHCCCGATHQDGPFPTEVSQQSQFTTDAKNLFLHTTTECLEDATRFSISVLAILTTVIVQCSIRLFVLIHSINRAFRTKKRISHHVRPFASFVDIPFSIGKDMSLGGRSFFIFHFLDRWSSQSTDESSSHNIILHAVTFDRAVVNSSHILVGKHGRLGILLGGIEFRLTIHLEQNNKTRNSTRIAAAAPKVSVESITISMRIESLGFGIIPSLPWLNARGLHFDGNVAFTNSDSSNTTKSNLLVGVYMSQRCNEVSAQIYQCYGDKISAGSLLKPNAHRRSVVSWDTIQSTFCLRERSVTSSSVEFDSINRVALLVSLPAGSTIVSSSPQRQASVFVAKVTSSSGDTHKSCRHRLTLGLDLEATSSLILAINWLLRDIAASVCSREVNSRDESRTIGKKKPKKSSTIEIVALDASFCTNVYLPLHAGQGFYFTTSNTYGFWRKRTDISAECVISRVTDIKIQSCKEDSCLDIIRLEGFDIKLIHAEKCATTHMGHLILRMNDQIIKQCAKLSNAARQAAAEASDLKSAHSSSNGQSTKLQNQSTSLLFDKLTITSSCIDAIVEMQPATIAQETSFDNSRLRVALLQKQAHAQVRYKRSRQLASKDDEYGIENKLPLPAALFETELQRYGCVCVFETNIEQFEASVTFYAHATLPTINDPPKDNETTYYAQTKQLQLKLASPPQSQIVCAVANEVRVYDVINTSLFSIPVHDDTIFDEDDTIQGRCTWSMMQLYDSNCDMAMILEGKGKFCRVERNDRAKSEKLELISIQLCRGTSQIYWSPVFQWLQASCNDRIQGGIEHIKSSLTGAASDKNIYNCRKTHIRFLVDSDTSAIFHTYLGKKTVMHTMLEHGMDVNVSMSKHLSELSGTLTGMKPNIRVETGRVLAAMNNESTPTFIFGGLSFTNYIRRASLDEISEYTQKQDDPFGDLDQDIVTDWKGHPMKEIFDLNINFCTAKFSPTLLFGEVIDDFLLTPRAIDLGLDSLKDNIIKREKKYQLMSIRIAFSFLDVSLLNDISSAGKTQPTTGDSVLQDIARVYFESILVEVERNTPPNITQSHISMLDEDSSALYTYGPSIQGGHLRRLTIDHAVATLVPLNLYIPLLRINSFDMTGHLFLTCISPETCGIVQGRTSDDLLLCHHSLSSKKSRSHCGCCYGVKSHSSGIPVKVYTDCKIRCNELDINHGPLMNESIPLLMECIQRLLPPPQPSAADDFDNIPLTWWDNLRFFVHGSADIFADRFSVRWLLDSQYLLDKSILLTTESFKFSHKLGYFGIDAADILVSLPSVSYNMSVHPSNMRRTSIDCTLPHEVDTAEEERHPIIHIPFINFSFNFVWKMMCDLTTASTAHHSPYINNSELADKFASFRTDGISTAKLQFDLHGGAGEVGNWILLRIDVLPWFTHRTYSTVPSSSSTDSQDTGSLPKLHSVDINLSIQELQIATWFTSERELNDWDDYDSEGACITVKSLRFTASGDDKDLVIEGPVKGALLDVREFLDSLTSRKTDDDGIAAIERACQSYGKDSATGTDSIKRHEMSTGSDASESSPFFKLQGLLGKINELDYVVNAGQIDIQNKSLQHILLGSRTTFGDEEFAGVNKTTWSILVSQLKILWTLDIRDNLMALTQDLMFTIGFMKAQMRQSQPLVNDQATNASSEDSEEGVEVTLSSPKQTSELEGKSRLEYLLQRNSSFDLDFTRTATYNDIKITSQPFERQNDEDSNPSLPTIDVHFSNPQVQLHRKTTGGSIILAMEGAHVEGRKFVRFLVDVHKIKGNVSPSDLTRRTEHCYTLTNMQAYSLNTRVDVTAGLPWLEVCAPIHKSTVDCQPDTTAQSYLEQRFGIVAHDSQGANNVNSNYTGEGNRGPAAAEETHQYIYPAHLRHHEPMAFVRSGFCSPILNKFTFKSRQSFHRPPIHYSKEELLAFIDRGLVSRHDDEIVDEVDLTIDLLSFTLDSYQMKQTFDIIRNVLLEPPKPRRHRFEADVNKPQTPSNRVRISSVAAIELEEVLASDSIHRGKHGRERLRAAAVALLRDLEDRQFLTGKVITRRVSYTLRKLMWRINSPDSIDNVELAFTGFFGQHDYCFDGSVSSQFSLGEFMCLDVPYTFIFRSRRIMPYCLILDTIEEDVRVSSTKPGPDAICFPDPTSIMKPVLDEKSPCVRCASRFDHGTNVLDACSYHDGKFESGVGLWSCCGLADRKHPGCKRAPHTGKERAALVRIDALPRIVEGITLYSHFEVNIYPEITHTTAVQISKSLSKLFMNYFFMDDGDDENDTKTKFATDGSIDSISHQSDSAVRQKSLLIGGKGSPRDRSHTDDDLSESLTETSTQTELVLIKVWRVGYINVELSVAGFKRIPQRTVDIRVHDYSKAYKIGSWGYLGKKYLTYLIHETLKSGASSAFRRKAVGNTTVENQNNQLMSKPPSSFDTDHDSLIGRHFRARPLGADTFLGVAPSIQKAKSKVKANKK